MQYNNFGKFLYNKRQALGCSLNKFALNNCIEPAILSRIENLKQDIKLQVLAKIAKGYNISVSELLHEYEITCKDYMEAHP